MGAANQKGFRCIAMAQHDEQQESGPYPTLIADLLDPESLEQAILDAKPDYIVHLAAISFVAHGSVAEIYQVNQL